MLKEKRFGALFLFKKKKKKRFVHSYSFFFFFFLLGFQIWMNAALPPLTVVARSVKTARVHSSAHAMMDSTFKQTLLPVLVRRNLNKYKCQPRGH